MSCVVKSSTELEGIVLYWIHTPLISNSHMYTTHYSQNYNAGTRKNDEIAEIGLKMAHVIVTVTCTASTMKPCLNFTAV